MASLLWSALIQPSTELYKYDGTASWPEYYITCIEFLKQILDLVIRSCAMSQDKYFIRKSDRLYQLVFFKLLNYISFNEMVLSIWLTSHMI